mmetsp:Transcript_21163/g.58851  ORF Transcript_21163/g.58851 Transcript_21163/m.58851 type:complete len:202 (-) Transcript_21163:430-1035(-)
MHNMKKEASRDMKLIKGITEVPQKIGQSVLSVPDLVFKKQHQGREDNEERDEVTDDSKELHGQVCSEIIEEQIARYSVAESMDECMREITNHLKLYLFEKSGMNSDVRYQYEEWILALHPENVHYIGSGRSLIDHRFYMRDSHHRKLWNEYMIKIDCEESIVKEESRSNNNSNRSLVNILMEEPVELCRVLSDSCCLSQKP